MRIKARSRTISVLFRAFLYLNNCSHFYEGGGRR